MNFDLPKLKRQKILDPELSNIDIFRARMRLGELSEEHVRYAAQLGDATSRSLFPNEIQLEVRAPILISCLLLKNLSKKFAIEFALWCVWKILPLFNNPYKINSANLINLVEKWLEQPSEDNEAKVKKASHNAMSRIPHQWIDNWVQGHMSWAITSLSSATGSEFHWAVESASAAKSVGLALNREVTDKDLLIRYLLK